MQPTAERYLSRLAAGLTAKGFRHSPYIMQSNCGVDSLQSVSRIPITMVESGPASKGPTGTGPLFGCARQGDTLRVTRLDRLARSTPDLYKLVSGLTDKGVALKVLDDSALDTSIRTGKLVIGQSFAAGRGIAAPSAGTEGCRACERA